MKFATEFEPSVYRMQAKRIITNLDSRNMNGYYYDSVEEAIQSVVDLIPEGATVGLGGSTTLLQCGLLDRLRTLPITLYDRYKEGISKEEINDMRTKSLIADVCIASTNALTLDGQLVNVDGIGNRVAAMINGPKKVILFAGVNKIVDSIESGFERIHMQTGPINVQRFGADTPCRDTGICEREVCRAPKSICNKYVVIEGEWDKDRMHVVIVGESFGF
jgi:hypothetical protein